MFLFHEHIWREPILLLKAFAEIELVIETNTQGHLLAGEGEESSRAYALSRRTPVRNSMTEKPVSSLNLVLI